MSDQRAQYTEEAVGAGHPTKTDTINRLTLVEHNNDGTHKASSKPLFSVHKNGSDQTVAGGAGWTQVTFGTEIFDTKACFASNTWTPTVAGKYLLSAQLYINAAEDAKQYACAIYKNGALANIGTVLHGSSTSPISVGITAIVDANGTTDAFTLYFYSDAAGGAVIEGTSTYTWFMGAFSEF